MDDTKVISNLGQGMRRLYTVEALFLYTSTRKPASVEFQILCLGQIYKDRRSRIPNRKPVT